MATYNFGAKSQQQIANLWEGKNVTHTRTNSADMSTAAAVSPVPESGEKLVLTDLIVSASVAMNFQLQEETSATVLAGPYYLPANSTIQITPRSRFLKVPTADKRIFGKASVAGSLTIETWVYSEV